MSFQNPAYRTRRMTLVGMEGMHSKMFDPPTESPATPERLDPTNPVPEVMQLVMPNSFKVTTPHTVQRDLLHGEMLTTWDGQDMHFMTFRDDDLESPWNGGHFPGPTIRVPRGVIFHATTKGHGPPPHTIHWHGQEPTTMNDGVGHCSMELGHYVYQWQPNFIGSYFYHCHRNTPLHFEMGMYGMLIIDPQNPNRVAGAPKLNKNKLATEPVAPYAFGGPGYVRRGNDIVRYDAEAIWVSDDVDPVWHGFSHGHDLAALGPAGIPAPKQGNVDPSCQTPSAVAR